MSWALIDFETRSTCDLKKSGAWAYSEHPTTEVLCLGWYIAGDNEYSLWRPGEDMPERLREHIAKGGTVLAHNVLFERCVWRDHMAKRFGWPDIDNDQWYDTMASCAYRNLPLGLGEASRVLDLPIQKTKMTTVFYKPNKKGIFPEMTEADYEYCRNDVGTEVQLAVRLGGLPPEERRVFNLDQRINERGVAVDLRYVRACQAVVDKASGPLAAEFADLTNGLTPGQRDKTLAWLRTQGVDLPNMQKETLDALLGESEVEDVPYDEFDFTAQQPIDLPPNARRALEIRRILGSASIKKLAAFRACYADDGRIHGLLQYHAGSTGGRRKSADQRGLSCFQRCLACS